MQKTRKRTTKLSLRRETLRSLDNQELADVAGATGTSCSGSPFTCDCSAHPSHAQCSNPCTLSY